MLAKKTKESVISSDLCNVGRSREDVENKENVQHVFRNGLGSDWVV